MKKLLAILSALTMLGALVSCGKDTADSSSTAESSAPETTAAESSQEESSEEESSASEPLPREAGPIDANAITFEDGELYTCRQVNGGGDECDIELSVVDLDGDKKLKVHALRDDPAEKYGVVKIVFNLPELLSCRTGSPSGTVPTSCSFTVFPCISSRLRCSSILP